MNLDFTEEQIMLKNSARSFLETECPMDLVRELEEDEKGYSPAMWKKMADLGWMGLVIPEEYDGMEMDFFDLIILFEEIGRKLLPGPFFSTVVLGSIPILEAGSEEQKKEFLPKISNGEAIFTMAALEENASYTPAGINMKAEARGDEYILNGTKFFAGYANVADYIICAARTGGGITLFIVDARSPGITCEVMPSIGEDKQCEVTFENVSVPKSSILGGLDKGWDILSGILEKAAIVKCAEMIGGCEVAMELTNNYSKERIQYGRAIANFQVLQHYMANMLINLETTRNLVYQAGWMLSEGMPCAELAAAAKDRANEAYKFITERGVHIHGAIGTTREMDISLYFRRAVAADYAFGDSDYQREVIVRNLGM